MNLLKLVYKENDLDQEIKKYDLIIKDFFEKREYEPQINELIDLSKKYFTPTQ